MKRKIIDNELKYINYDSANDNYKIRKNHKYFCSFKNLNEAIKARNWLIEHNWNKEEFKKLISNKYKHYHKKSGSYIIRKQVDNISVVYARCKTKEEAKKTVEVLEKLNWDREKFREMNKLNPSFIEEMEEIEKEKDIKIKNIDEIFDKEE